MEMLVYFTFAALRTPYMQLHVTHTVLKITLSTLPKIEDKLTSKL